MNNNLVLGKCPVCKSPSIVKQFKFTYHKPVVYGSIKITLEKDPELWKCKDCKSLFVQNTLPEKYALKLYQESNSEERWPAKKFETEKQPKIVKSIKRMLSPGDCVLDVGANTGEFLDFAKKLGCKTFAVEPSIVAHSILKQKGHACFPSIEEACGKYDFIFAFDLVEHLYNIPAFFKECRKLLTEDGSIVLLIGNCNCLAAEKQKDRWSYILYPEHVVVPSLYGLNRIDQLYVEKFLPVKNSYQPLRKYYYALRKVIDHQKLIYLLDLLNDHFLVVMKRCEK